MLNKIISIANQKGGCGKTTLTLNLGVALARYGKKVLLIDMDPQANMTMALGCHNPDELPCTIAHIFYEIVISQQKPERSKMIQKREYVYQSQGIDFIPSCIELAGIENNLVNAISRENVLKRFLNCIKDDYDHIIIDCMPSLNFITINALAAANSVLIPVQPQFFSAKGLEMLLQTIIDVKENLNADLKIEGALVTMYNNRLNFSKMVVDSITLVYGQYFRVFETKIPVSVRVTETQSQGLSIFDYDPKGRVAEGYCEFAKELLRGE